MVAVSEISQKGSDRLSYKKDFPLLNLSGGEHHGLRSGCPYVYLDSAASAHKPQVVIDAMSSFYTSQYSNIHRGAHRLSVKATEAYEAARETARSFIGATHREEIIFCRGATEGINMIAVGFLASKLQPGDEILVSEMEHHANLIPWQQIAHKTKARLVKILVDDDGQVDPEQIAGAISHCTKLVALTHVSNVLGTINPIKNIIAEIRNVSKKMRTEPIPVLIDGAQSVVHQKVNVSDLDCDFFVFSGHKIYGPTGIGVLYAKKDWHPGFQPLLYGGGMVDQVTFDSSTFDVAPGCYEAGTPNIAGAIGLAAAIDYLGGIDGEAIHSELAKCTADLMIGLTAFKGLRILGPTLDVSDRIPMVSFSIDDVHAHDLATMLDEYGIAVRAGHHCAQPLLRRFDMASAVRVSLGLYNSSADCSYFLDKLSKSVSFFR